MTGASGHARCLVSSRPADAWPHADELIEGVEFEDEEAARRFDLDWAVGASGRPPGGDVADTGPWMEFFTWEEAERWLREGPAYVVPAPYQRPGTIATTRRDAWGLGDCASHR